MALADMAFASAFWDGRSQRVLPGATRSNSGLSVKKLST